MTATVGAARTPGQWLSVAARQRELSLVAIMFVLGGLVSMHLALTYPQTYGAAASLWSVLAGTGQWHRAPRSDPHARQAAAR